MYCGVSIFTIHYVASLFGLLFFIQLAGTRRRANWTLRLGHEWRGAEGAAIGRRTLQKMAGESRGFAEKRVNFSLRTTCKFVFLICYMCKSAYL